MFNKLEIKNDRIELYAKKGSPRQDLLYSTTFAAFDQISEWSKNNHVPLLVVIIPDHLQVIDQSVFAGYDINKPQQKVTEYLDSKNILYIDLLPHFLNAQDPQKLFFREDKHWTADAHNYVSVIVFNHVNGENIN